MEKQTQQHLDSARSFTNELRRVQQQIQNGGGNQPAPPLNLNSFIQECEKYYGWAQTNSETIQTALTSPSTQQQGQGQGGGRGA